MVCREAFRWDATNGLPEYCEVCHEYIGSDGKDEVAAPSIATFRGKNPDRLYRDMEAKSEFRAQQAAEMMGDSSVDTSHLRMTDMKDGMREGDTAFKPVVNDVTRAMDAAPQQTGFSPQAQQIGLQASAGTRVGPYPNAGTDYIQNVLKQNHGRNYRAPISDNPSLGVRELPRNRWGRP
jgi:hypothetical protein